MRHLAQISDAQLRIGETIGRNDRGEMDSRLALTRARAA